MQNQFPKIKEKRGEGNKIRMYFCSLCGRKSKSPLVEHFKKFHLERDLEKIFFFLSKKPVDLLLIKSPCLEQNYFDANKIDFYLNRIKRIIKGRVNSIISNGFCVIQTKDIRVNGYIEPLAKRIVDMLSGSSLKLKEIVIASQEKQNKETYSIKNSQLEIAHKYLLIYQKTK